MVAKPVGTCTRLRRQKVADHLAEGRILLADLREVVASGLIELHDLLLSRRHAESARHRPTLAKGCVSAGMSAARCLLNEFRSSSARVASSPQVPRRARFPKLSRLTFPRCPEPDGCHRQSWHDSGPSRPSRSAARCKSDVRANVPGASRGISCRQASSGFRIPEPCAVAGPRAAASEPDPRTAPV